MIFSCTDCHDPTRNSNQIGLGSDPKPEEIEVSAESDGLEVDELFETVKEVIFVVPVCVSVCMLSV